MPSPQGFLLVVSGPSGAGKSTTLNAWMAGREDVEFSVSVTTRAPRAGERDGVEYHFITEEQFLSMRDSGQLLEHTFYAGHGYGTPAAPVEAAIRAGRVLVLDIDVAGALQVKERLPGVVLVFLCPSSLEEVERRLRARRTEDEERICRRMEIARGEIALWRDYHYRVYNDDLGEALRALDGIVLAERCRVNRLYESWEDVC